jgi:hypothetical protein
MVTIVSRPLHDVNISATDHLLERLPTQLGLNRRMKAVFSSHLGPEASILK